MIFSAEWEDFRYVAANPSSRKTFSYSKHVRIKCRKLVYKSIIAVFLIVLNCFWRGFGVGGEDGYYAGVGCSEI